MDRSASWTLTGVNTIGTVVNNGTSGASGSLAGSAAIDPSSKGLFLRASGAMLEVAAALGQHPNELLGGQQSSWSIMSHRSLLP